MSATSFRGPRTSGLLLWRIGLGLSATLAALNLVVGASGGLARMGLPAFQAAISVHGAVMVCGVFGTLIALERAVALRRYAGLTAPLAAGVGGVLAWSVQETTAPAQLAWLLAASGLIGLYVLAGVTRAWSTVLLVELCGALCWGGGTLAWAAGDLAAAKIGWMAFLVLTIGAERRELTQLIRLPVLARRLYVGIVLLALSSVALATAAAFGANTEELVSGPWWASCAGLAIWLLVWDIAPRQWGGPGWRGHTAQCLTIGYCWLLFGSLIGMAAWRWPGGVTGLALHAVLLGFVLSMVFGHAPIILPSLLRVRPVYSVWARVPIWILSASLALRGGGALSGSLDLLALAGIGHVLAIAWFALAMLIAMMRGRQAGP